MRCFMKKILIYCLTAVIMTLSFTACHTATPKEISCEEIISTYKAAGYSVLYHDHDGDTAYNDLGIYCSFEIRDPDNADNYMYVDRYFTEEAAISAAKENEFHPVLWFFSSIFGESRWLYTGRYGDLTYSTFDKKMIKPLKDLINQK